MIILLSVVETTISLPTMGYLLVARAHNVFIDRDLSTITDLLVIALLTISLLIGLFLSLNFTLRLSVYD